MLGYFRARIVLALFAAVSLLVAGLVLSSSAGQAEDAAQPLASNGVSVQLGPEQVVLGPSSEIDIPYSTLVDSSGKVHGFMANSASWVYDVGAAGKLVNGRKIFSSGAKGATDQCGAHILDPYRVSATHWVALYHGEKADPSLNNGGCTWAGNHTQWSLSYVETNDAGKTWVKSGQAITQDKALMGNHLTDDAGSGWVVAKDGYLYLFFQAKDRTGAMGLNVARATVASMGKPGSWWKYYCVNPSQPSTCGYTQPGLGGQATQIPVIPSSARDITWNTYLHRWVAVYATGRHGFQLWMSDGDDFMQWHQADLHSIYPAVSTPTDPRIDSWGNYQPGDGQVYGYSSLIGLDGSSSTTGQNMWLYYMKVFPGDGFAHRYLIRRELSLAPVAGAADRVQIATYVNAKGQRFSSTEAPPPSQGYARTGSAGFLLTDARAGYAALFDCRTARGDDYLARQCGRDATVRRVGWIAPQKTSAATVPLLSCDNRTLNDRYESQSCGRDAKLWQLGWVLPSIAPGTYPLESTPKPITTGAAKSPTSVNAKEDAEPVVSITGITRVRKGKHNWKVQATVTKDAAPWPSQLVRLQVKTKKKGWRLLAAVKTNRHGVVRWRGHAAGRLRFRVAGLGAYPQATSTTFRAPRRTA